MPEHKNLAEAVLAVQASLPTLPKDGSNPAFKGSHYTKLDTIVELVTPKLCEHGLVWMTFPTTDDGDPALRYSLKHAASGESEGDVMKLLLGKNDPQGQGSAITYARRYSLCAALNLVADEDDDGNGASHGEAPLPAVKPATKRPDAKLIPEDEVAIIAREYAATGWKDPEAEDPHSVLRVTLLTLKAPKTDGEIVECIRALTAKQASDLRREFKKPADKPE